MSCVEGWVIPSQPGYTYRRRRRKAFDWSIQKTKSKNTNTYTKLYYELWVVYRAGICIRRAAAAGNRPIHPQGHRPGLLGDYMRPHQNTILTKLFGLLGELLTPYQNTVLTILLGLLGGYMRPHQKNYFEQITNKVDRHCWVLTYFVTKDAYNCCNEKPLV